LKEREKERKNGREKKEIEKGRKKEGGKRE